MSGRVSIMPGARAVESIMHLIHRLDDSEFASLYKLVERAREERALPQVLVTVRELGGQDVFGPQLTPASTSALGLKRKLGEALGENPEEMDLLCGSVLLQPIDTLASLGEHFQGSLELVRRPEKAQILPLTIPRAFKALFKAALPMREIPLVVPGYNSWDKANETFCLADSTCQASLEGQGLSEAFFRSWDPFQSEIAAAIVGGICTSPKWHGDRLLAIGMSGRELSYFADLVGTDGGVKFHALEPRGAEDLSKLKRDWPHVEELVDILDGREFDCLILRGSAEVHQTVLHRLKSLLNPGATVMWAVQATQSPPDMYFARHVEAVRKAGLKPKEQITLEPYFEDCAVIIAQTTRDWPT